MAQMRSRREQVEAHRFITRRMNLALLSGEPESTELPMRRIGLAVFASVMIGTLVFAVFGIIALLGKGSDDPRFGTIIIEKETGTLYVWAPLPTETPEGSEGEGQAAQQAAAGSDQCANPDDCRLYPVENYASALLIIGQPDPEIQRMQQSSLRDLPRGNPVGLRDAPATLFPADNMQQNKDWNVCVTPVEAGHDFLVTQVSIRDLAAPNALADEAMLVEANGSKHLLWNDHRLEVPNDAALTAIRMNPADSFPVSAAWLQTVPVGPTLEAPIEVSDDVTDIQLDNGEFATVGTVVTSNEQFFVVTADNTFGRIGEVSAELLTSGQSDDELPSVSNDMLAQFTTTEVEPEGFPQAIPTDRGLPTGSQDQAAVCSTYSPSADNAQVVVNTWDQAPPELVTAAEDTQLNEAGGLASGDDAIVDIAGGTGVLAGRLANPEATITTLTYLIDDQGVKYAFVEGVGGIAAGQVQSWLGYGEVTPVGIPAEFLELVPDGADLDPIEARSFLDPVDRDTAVDPTTDTSDSEESEGE